VVHRDSQKTPALKGVLPAVPMFNFGSRSLVCAWSV
jgi:hypothetical protein